MTNIISPKLAKRLELRGVQVEYNSAFARMIPWTRTSFALCGTMVGVGTITANIPLLWAMVWIVRA